METESTSQDMSSVTETALTPDHSVFESLCSDSVTIDEATSSGDRGKDVTGKYSPKEKRKRSTHKPYCCNECGKCFGYRTHLLRHENTHTGQKPFSCSVCEKPFNQKTSLLRHEKSHTGEKPFTCRYCDKCFFTKFNLSDHEKTHTGEKPFPCSVCGKCFRTRSNRGEHKKVHTGVKPFSCEVCGKRFRNSSHLTQHRRDHTGEKPFPCPECGKFFSQKSNLVKHRKIHAGEKPFSCIDCKKCFSSGYNLSRHRMLIHTGGKPFVCSICKLRFGKKSEVRKHKKDDHGIEKPPRQNRKKRVSQNDDLSHTERKAFGCGVCKLRFDKKSEVAKHKKEDHGIEKPPPRRKRMKRVSQDDDLSQQQRTSIRGEEISVVEGLSWDVPPSQENESEAIPGNVEHSSNESFGDLTVKKEFDPLGESPQNEEIHPLKDFIKKEIEERFTPVVEIFVKEEGNPW